MYLILALLPITLATQSELISCHDEFHANGTEAAELVRRLSSAVASHRTEDLFQPETLHPKQIGLLSTAKEMDTQVLSVARADVLAITESLHTVVRFLLIEALNPDGKKNTRDLVSEIRTLSTQSDERQIQTVYQVYQRLSILVLGSAQRPLSAQQVDAFVKATRTRQSRTIQPIALFTALIEAWKPVLQRNPEAVRFAIHSHLRQIATEDPKLLQAWVNKVSPKAGRQGWVGKKSPITGTETLSSQTEPSLEIDRVLLGMTPLSAALRKWNEAARTDSHWFDRDGGLATIRHAAERTGLDQFQEWQKFNKFWENEETSRLFVGVLDGSAYLGESNYRSLVPLITHLDTFFEVFDGAAKRNHVGAIPLLIHEMMDWFIEQNPTPKQLIRVLEVSADLSDKERLVHILRTQLEERILSTKTIEEFRETASEFRSGLLYPLRNRKDLIPFEVSAATTQHWLSLKPTAEQSISFGSSIAQGAADSSSFFMTCLRATFHDSHAMVQFVSALMRATPSSPIAAKASKLIVAELGANRGLIENALQKSPELSVSLLPSLAAMGNLLFSHTHTTYGRFSSDEDEENHQFGTQTWGLVYRYAMDSRLWKNLSLDQILTLVELKPHQRFHNLREKDALWRPNFKVFLEKNPTPEDVKKYLHTATSPYEFTMLLAEILESETDQALFQFYLSVGFDQLRNSSGYWGSFYGQPSLTATQEQTLRLKLKTPSILKKIEEWYTPNRYDCLSALSSLLK